MANSKIRIEFLATPGVNEFLSFSESNLGLSIIETFRPNRLGSNQVKLPELINGSISGNDYDSVLATNYFTAFWFDYNASNLFTIQWFPGSGSTSHLGSVEITANYPNAFFTLIETPPGTNVVITNASAVTPITIDAINFSQASNACDGVRVNVQTSVLATKIISPVVVNANTNNPFSFDFLRGSTIDLIVENADNQQTTQRITLPPILTVNNFQIGINNSPNGATVTITPSNSVGLDIEYSLDGISWQSSNVFNGLDVGTFTLYVRDQLGCSFTKSFEVTQFGIYTPYFYISKSNSIRFANRIVWGDAANYKNDENTLGCEVDEELPYCGCQNFKTANVITTQFKSNYKTNTVKILRDPLLFPPTEAKSNILFYSENLANSVWSKNEVTLSGKKVVPTTVYAFHKISQIVNKGNQSGIYTFSALIKPDGYNNVMIQMTDSLNSAQVFVYFNFSTQSFYGGFGFSGFTFIGSSYTIEENGFYRLSLKAQLNVTENITLSIQIGTDYTGDGTSGVFIDKLQFQKGNITDYAITTNAPVYIDASDGNVYVPVVKMSNNIGIKDKRDARKYDLGNGKTGIYFTTGNVYNFDTNVVSGSHFLSGSLPDWAIEGGYIVIGTTWFTIEDIFYSEDKAADVIVISNLYTGSDTSEIVGSIYNDFNYEIYEFTIDMVDYLNQTIQVEIKAVDSNFETVTHLSEKIDVAVNFENNVEIYYWNDDNTDVFYATGIRNLINAELTKQEGVSEEESDTYKTDTTALLLSAQLYELNNFIFEPVSKEIWRKIMIALSHKNVFINGVQYVKSGNFETEGPLEDTNLYVLQAKMLKTGIVYNADSADGADFNTGSIEIPGLIQTEIGFVKY